MSGRRWVHSDRLTSPAPFSTIRSRPTGWGIPSKVAVEKYAFFTRWTPSSAASKIST